MFFQLKLLKLEKASEIKKPETKASVSEASETDAHQIEATETEKSETETPKRTDPETKFYEIVNLKITAPGIETRNWIHVDTDISVSNEETVEPESLVVSEILS